MSETAGNPADAGSAGPVNAGGTDAGGSGTSAPVSSSPSSSSASASASLERAASSLESTSSVDNPDNAGASSDVQPGGAASHPATSGNADRFHLPKDKADYDRILANARAKAAEDVESRYAWAKRFENYDPDAIAEAVELYQQFGQDPVALARQIIADASSGEEDLTDPEADYIGPDGKTKFYSQETLDKRLSNMEKRLLGKLQPALTLAERSEQQERVRQITVQAQASAKEALDEVRQYPNFTKYQGQIAEKLASMGEIRKRYGTIAALHMAYQAVMNENQAVIRQDTENTIRTQNLKKARAGEGHVVPGDASMSRKPVKDGDVDALARRIGELSQTMAG